MKKFNIFAILCALAWLGSLSPAFSQLSSNLVLHYTFDTDEGAVITDVSGSGRFAWAHGATWAADEVRGGVFRFDSNQQYIVADDVGLPIGDAPRTMALWVKLDSLASDPVTSLLTYGNQSWNQLSGIGLDWRNGRANAYFTQNGAVALSRWRMTEAGQWHHLAYIYEGNGQHHFYVDGILSDGMSESLGSIDTVLSGAVLIGAAPNGTGPAGGFLDDVRIYNQALTAEEVADLAAPPEPGSDGLVLHYTFDGDTLDVSGNGHDGILYGGTYVEDRNGNSEGALAFDGSLNDYVDAGEIHISLPATISLWFKSSSTNAPWGTLLGWNLPYTPYAGIQIAATGNGRMISRIGDEFTNYETSVAPDGDGQWHLFTVSRDANGHHLIYVDGQLEGSQIIAASIGSEHTLYIGRSFRPDDYFMNEHFRGAIDDVRIYNRVLSAEEVADLAAPFEFDPGISTGNTGEGPDGNCEFHIISNGEGSESSLTIQWVCVPGMLYDLYWTDNLITGFSIIASGLVSDGAEISVDIKAGERTGFYKVIPRQ